MMKKILFIVFTIFVTQQLFAQVEITPYYGWQWTGAIPLYYSPSYYNDQDAKVDDKANYGIRLGVRLPTYVIAEFEWNHTETNLSYRNLNGEEVTVPLTINYYWLGGIREASEGPVIPYGVFNIGAADFRGPEDNVVAFATAFGGGIKYFLNETIGIRLQARIMIPIQFGGVSFGCGSAGCGSGVGGWSTIIQGDFTGGIVLKLGS